jgi:DNA-binding transcriptional MocR family regulator
LSQLDRDAEASITAQLADLLVAAIERGDLAPGDKLPTTRALAADAGVNHLTAARVYKRLAEQGYVSASVGRGTFVRSLTPAAEEQHGDDWQLYALPDRPPTYADQILDDAFRLARKQGIISLATSWPSPELFPTEELAGIAADVFRDLGHDAVSYGNVEGVPELREQIARLGRAEGFASDADEVVVTSGARQAIDLVARTVLEPGDVAVIESPSFIGCLSSLQRAGARVIGVPVDANGFDVDALEQVLARHEVKLVALQTECQNPTGRTTSSERIARLAALARERNFFVLEDGVYAGFPFDGKSGRRLREQAPGHVVYVDSLSKIAGGGMRIGWLAAQGPVRNRLAALKLETDFHSPTLTQHMATRFLAGGTLERLREEGRPFYRARRDALMEALDKHMSGEYRADLPQGGHHVWVTLQRPVDERTLYAAAVRHGVTFTPGGTVLPERTVQTSLRLSFSLVEPDQLDEGVKRLARAVREVRRAERHTATMPLS